MIRISDRGLCCGCGACEAVCPRGAIRLERDAMGFEYPKVSGELCTDCGLCEKVCAFREAVEAYERNGGAENCAAGCAESFAVGFSEGFSESFSEGGAESCAAGGGLHRPLRTVAARHRSLHEIMRSRSGAAFPALTEALLLRGGTVFGAELSRDCRSVKHRAADSIEARDRFRGSKYIQSSTAEAFAQLRRELSDGREVVFSGTPCQCHALLRFIPAALQKNLTLIDFVCHGVASPVFWDRYLDYIGNGRNVVQADFRDKIRFGWKDHRETFTLSDGSFKFSRSFTDIYYKHLMMRPSCLRCPFCSTYRCSDITLADFWGWEKTAPSLNADDWGCSLILVNSPKGMKLLDEASGLLEIKEVRLDDCLQRPLKERLVPGAKSAAFEKDFISGTAMSTLLRRYGDKNLRTALRRFYLSLRKSLRKMLKRCCESGVRVVEE